MTIDMGQFFQVFFDETEELLAEMEKLLLAIDLAAPDQEDLNAIFRAAHSIKGGAGTFGLHDLIDVTHVLESLLDRIRKGEMTLTAEHVDAFLAAKDILKMQLDGHRLHTAVDREAVADVRMMLESLSQGQQVPVMLPAPALEVDRERDGQEQEGGPAPDGGRVVQLALPAMAERDTAALAAELALLGEIRSNFADTEKTLFTLYTAETLENILAICSFLHDAEDVSLVEERRVDPDAEARRAAAAARAAEEEAQGYGFFEPIDETTPQQAAEPVSGPHSKEQEVKQQGVKEHGSGKNTIESRQPASAGAAGAEKRSGVKREAERISASQESSSIRVGIEKVDQLINLVGELVITQAMIEQRTIGLDPIAHERLHASVSQLTRNTRDLQEAVMSIRMMPMDYVFSRFPRMVRDIAMKLGKRIDFVTIGAATELDKGLIERIVDPLTHLVRNSIDHGIEMPEMRRAAGKSETGRLILSAGQQGGNIIIEVADDGGGLNREKILAKAQQQGLSVSDAISDAEVWQLIFAPGFSTAETVTDVSGRGVGMDVVKRNITAMGGSVDIRSVKGSGTTVSISLPLTLAILDGMSVRVGDEVYILPLGYIVESLQPDARDVKYISGHGRVVKVRGQYLPILPLHEVFDVTPRFTDPSQGIVVILESDGKQAALFVDDLVGQQQVVVKNLESNYRKVVGVSGATILGDGGVALIVDVAALLRSSRPMSEPAVFS